MNKGSGNTPEPFLCKPNEKPGNSTRKAIYIDHASYRSSPVASFPKVRMRLQEIRQELYVLYASWRATVKQNT